jgi:hypothetical protein
MHSTTTAAAAGICARFDSRVLGSMSHPNVVRHHETFLAGGRQGALLLGRGCRAYRQQHQQQHQQQQVYMPSCQHPASKAPTAEQERCSAQTALAAEEPTADLGSSMGSTAV